MSFLRWVDIGAVAALALVGVAMLGVGIAEVVMGRRTRGVRRAGVPRAVLVVCLVAAVAVVLVLTVPSGAVARNGGGVNLVPGRTLVAQFEALNGPFVLANLTGNVGVFVPIGYFAALLVVAMTRPGVAVTRRTTAVTRSPWWTVPAVAGLSVVVETLQLFGGRTSDIDDVLLNTVGGAVGVGLALLVERAAGSGGERRRT